jgi:hypothetical protein
MHNLRKPGCFMNCRRETVKMAVPPGNRPAVPRDWIRGGLEQYGAGPDTRGRLGGQSYPRSQQAIHRNIRARGMEVLRCMSGPSSSPLLEVHSGSASLS